MRIAIVGGGIGGLSAAAFLGRAGHEVVLFEKASAFGEVGAGIQLSPNGSRVLAALGLGDQILDIGTPAERVVFRRWDDDRELFVGPGGDVMASRHGQPHVSVFRPDLIDALAGVLPEGVDVRLGAEVVGVGADTRRPSVKLASGDVIAADVIIGADGIHSAVRNAVFGPMPGRFSGWAAFRALVPGERVGDLAIETTNRLGPGRHLVSYFVGRDRRFLNLVCVVPEPSWNVESWTEPGDMAELRAHFAGWSAPVHELLDRIEGPIFKWALYDRPPLEQWTDGRITLLGDACHPMVPFMAQGACMAIEDAAVLTRAFDAFEDPAEALHRYERARLPRTARIQGGSWRNCTVFHLDDGREQQRRDAAYAERSSTAPSRDSDAAPFDGVFGYDAFAASFD